MLDQQLVNGLLLGSLYALVAIGYSLVLGLLNLLNFAHGEIFMAGAFITYLALGPLHLPPPVAAILGIVGAGVLGLVLEVTCFQFVDKKYDVAPMASTVGFGLVLSNLAARISGSEAQVFALANNTGDIQIGNVLISAVQLISLIVAAVIMLLLHLIIMRTSIGRSWRAISENLVASRLVGVNVTRSILIAFFISSALAGVAGLLIAARLGKVSPFMGETIGMKGLAVMVIGGLGNVQGAMLGGIMLGIIEVLNAAYGQARFNDAIVWGALLAILLWRPTGLLGRNIRER